MDITSSPDLSTYSLLGVFAHPDDESIASGGLLAWCSDLGAHITIACLTRGENGGRQQRDLLGQTRTLELEAAAHVLGANDLVILNHEDGMLPWIDAYTLEKDIGDIVERVIPDVVVTFGEDGLYWHPDHITVHQRTTSVVRRMTKQPPSLYYVTMPQGCMPALVRHVRDYEDYPLDTQLQNGILGVTNTDAFGSHAAPPTLVLSIRDLAQRKLRAIQCHKSQVNNTELSFLRLEDAEQFLGTEHYRRASVGFQGECLIEQLAKK